ncbi:MAG: long-chain fatty acid--CoA ligase [Actinomycetota bacterium]|nr:long-chain fatty acid--CoA ligase [Actinomycetota bacterium]
MNAAAEIDAYAEGKTIPLVFLDMLAHNGPRVAFRWKASSESGDAWSEVTWDLFADDVARAAAGLAARGLGRGDRLMLMLRNVYEFHVLDTAALFLGATPVSIYNSSAVEQVRYLVSDAGATLAVVENDAFLRLFQAARPDLPRLTGVGVVSSNGTVSSNESGAGFTYADLLSAEPLDLATAAGNANPDDLATLIYTSGTTGPSKGVMIDHRNVVWTAECLRRSFGWEAERMAGMRVISYLPMAHIAERMVSHYQSLAFGYEITCCPDPTLIAAYAGEVRPQVMFGVPRVWEKIYAGVNAALAADPDKQRAVNDGIASAAPLERKITMGTASQEELDTYQFLDDVAFRLIRELVGLDQLQAAITGAAPIPAEILSWFRTIGVPLSEIYGLSETTGPMTWERVRVKAGSVGVACPGVEVALAEDGEVICRGGNVFRGYLNLPEKTAEVLDADGWFHSGDIGEFDDEGYLKIVDRKKELIITAGGKNLSPANLEARLKMIPLVGQACAIGDLRPFVTALVVLDPDAAPRFAASNGIAYTSLAELAEHPRIVAEIEGALPEAMAGFNNTEKVKKIKILGKEWLPDTDLLTPTSKLKRRGVHARFAEEIEALYR